MPASKEATFEKKKQYSLLIRYNQLVYSTGKKQQYYINAHFYYCYLTTP